MFTIILVCPTDRLPTHYRQFANRSLTVGKHFGLEHNANCWPSVGQLLADSIFWELFFTITDLTVLESWLFLGYTLCKLYTIIIVIYSV